MTSPADHEMASTGQETTGIEKWLKQNVVARMEEAGVEVQDDAFTLLSFASHNQLRTRSVRSEARLCEILDKLSPHLVSAYLFKHGAAPMTFGRAVQLLADMSERLRELRREA